MSSDASRIEAPPLWQGRALVVLAALLWSSSGFFAKATTFAAWPGPLLAFWRAVFASLVLVPLACLPLWMERRATAIVPAGAARSLPSPRQPYWSWWLVPMVLSFVVMNWTYLSAMKLGTAAATIWLQSTAPLWVLLVGVSFLGEKFTRRDASLLVCGLSGVSVILFFELQGKSPTAALLGLLSGVFYAAVVVCLRQLRAMNAAWLIALNHMATAICLIPYVAMAEQFPQGTQWLYLFGFGVLQMGMPYVLFARALRSISGHEAGGIGLLEPLLVPVWTYLAWGEEVTWPIVAGGALIFAGLAWRYLRVAPAG